MNGIFLCSLALFALPSVIAISCYTCIPVPGIDLCNNATNITNCDDEAPIVPGTAYDVCTRSTLEVKMGVMTFTSYVLTCGVQALHCGKMAKETSCNATRDAVASGGMQLEKCDLTCCDKDKCNGGGQTPTQKGVTSAASSPQATSSVTSTHESRSPTSKPTDEGTTTASSFFITAISLLVLLSGFFGH